MLTTLAMLEHIFGSTTRAKLLAFFGTHPDEAVFVRELTRRIRGQLTAVRRELENLTKLGVLTVEGAGRKRYHRANPAFPLAHELRAFVFKGQVLLELDLSRRLQRVGRPDLVVLTGFFTDSPHSSVDVLIVGAINRRKVKRLLTAIQRELDHQVRYTVLTRREFAFRNDIADRFLYDILEGRRIVILDRLGVSA